MERRTFAGWVALVALSVASAAVAAPEARVSRAELATLRDAKVGDFVLLANAPLDATRTGGVRLKRIDVYRMGCARCRAATGAISSLIPTTRPRRCWPCR